MPGFNSKGPMGEGPRSGRGLGRCKTPTAPIEEKSSDSTSNVAFGAGQQRHGQGMGNQSGRRMNGGGRGRNR